MTPITPSRALVRLLRSVSSRHAADSVVGDIQEQVHEARATGRGPRWPRLSLNLLIAGAIVVTVATALPRRLRGIGLIVSDTWRGVRRAPAHTAMVVGVLAIGITAGTVTFSVVDAVLLKPLPIKGGDRLIFISSFDEKTRKNRITGETFWQLHDHSQTLDGVASFMRLFGSSSSVGGVTDEFPVTLATSGAFRLLQVSAGVGRLWTADEEARGETDVAVLGYRFWQRDLGGRSDVLGLTVARGTRTYRVIGVLSAASDHPGIGMLSGAIWLPGTVAKNLQGASISMLARVRPDRTRPMVVDELRALTAAHEWMPSIYGPLEAERERAGRWLLLALGASCLLVLLGCVNAANLMLSRSVRRGRELAVRSSLGASHRQLAGSVIVEGLLLSLIATAFALVMASWGVSLAKYAMSTMPLGISQAAGIALNGRVVIAAIVSAFITGVLFALVPAWQASRTSIVSALKDGSPLGSGGRGLWRRAFLVTEVATVTVLLVLSWLFVTSLVRVVGTDLGVDRGSLIGVSPRVAYTAPTDEVVERITRVPGVVGVAESTGTMSSLFLSGVWMTTELSALDVPPAAPVKEVLQYRVTPNYFAIAGIEFMRGSVWADGVPNPVVLDDIVARRLFGEADPLGRQVRASEPSGVHTVVGVVPSLRARGPEQELQPAAYFPPDRRRRSYAKLLVRTTGPPDAVALRLAEALAPVAPDQKDRFIYSFNEATRTMTMMRRFNAGLMSIFGLLGVLIGAAGIYAVTSSVVAQQTNEIGVRMALGATPQHVARQVLISTLGHVGLGLAIGLPMAWWLTRGLGSLLFGVTPTDLGVHAGVSAMISAVGLAAALLPARRAARVDPIVSLRA